MSNTWTVEWEGERADMAREILMNGNASTPVRCGHSGALWRVGDWQELSGERIGALLLPVNSHVRPTYAPPELPMPNVVR